MGKKKEKPIISQTDYRQDYVVTWKDDSVEMQEGFSTKDLSNWKGKTPVDKIMEIYKFFNASISKKDHREVTKIEYVKRKLLWER